MNIKQSSEAKAKAQKSKKAKKAKKANVDAWGRAVEKTMGRKKPMSHAEYAKGVTKIK